MGERRLQGHTEEKRAPGAVPPRGSRFVDHGEVKVRRYFVLALVGLAFSERANARHLEAVESGLHLKQVSDGDPPFPLTHVLGLVVASEERCDRVVQREQAVSDRDSGEQAGRGS